MLSARAHFIGIVNCVYSYINVNCGMAVEYTVYSVLIYYISQNDRHILFLNRHAYTYRYTCAHFKSSAYALHIRLIHMRLQIHALN